MKFLYGLYGATIPVIREFDIDKNTKIEAGTIVRISSEGEIGNEKTVGECLGVAAEDHSGKKDILNARADGEKLRVDITGGGVYSVAALKLCVSRKASATTFVCQKAFLGTSLTGSKLVLVRKGENSSNTDEIGAERTIYMSDETESESVLEISSGGTPDVGDVYVFLPKFGFKGQVATDGKSFCVTDGIGVMLTVVGTNKDTLSLEVLLDKYLD